LNNLLNTRKDIGYIEQNSINTNVTGSFNINTNGVNIRVASNNRVPFISNLSHDLENISSVKGAIITDDIITDVTSSLIRYVGLDII
jgi:hypothetical protein